MRKLILLIALAAAGRLKAAAGPCSLTNPDPTACRALYTFAATPPLDTFLGWQETSLGVLNAWAAVRPQPKIPFTAQVIPWSGAWLATLPGVYGPQIVPFQNALAACAPGPCIKVQRVNLWPAMFSSDPTYAASHGGTFPSDCTGGVTFAYGSAPPSPFSANGPRCKALWYSDQAAANAAAKSITVLAGFFAGAGNTISQWTASPPSLCNYTQNSITAAQFNACLNPLEAAGMDRYKGVLAIGTEVQVFEEATGGTKLFQNPVYNITDVGTILTAGCAAVHGVIPTAKCAAAGLNGDDAYFTDWITNAGTYGLNALVVDVFQSHCDNSTTYSQDVLAFVATSGHWGMAANAASIPWSVGQAEFPYWCAAGGPSTLAGMYSGTLDKIWESTGLHNAWQAMFAGVFSAAGATSVTQYGSALALLYNTSNQAADSVLPGTLGPVNAMGALSPTMALGSLGNINAGQSTSWRGRVTLSGRSQSQ